jgi:hypothetical protein
MTPHDAVKPSARFPAHPTRKTRKWRRTAQQKGTRMGPLDFRSLLSDRGRKLRRRAFLCCVAVAGVSSPPAASAADYSCGQITVTATLEGGGAFPVAIAKDVRLDLHIDPDRPELSGLRWSGSGDPRLDARSTSWPADAKIAIVDGAVTVHMAAVGEGATSVVSLSISPDGNLETAEDTTVTSAHAIVHHVVRGRCAIARSTGALGDIKSSRRGI